MDNGSDEIRFDQSFQKFFFHSKFSTEQGGYYGFRTDIFFIQRSGLQPSESVESLGIMQNQSNPNPPSPSPTLPCNPSNTEKVTLHICSLYTNIDLTQLKYIHIEIQQYLYKYCSKVQLRAKETLKHCPSKSSQMKTNQHDILTVGQQTETRNEMHVNRLQKQHRSEVSERL